MQYALQLGLMRYRGNLAAIGNELVSHSRQGGGGENGSHHSVRCGAFRDGALPAPVDVAVVGAPMGGLEIRQPETLRLATAEMAVKAGAERREMGACAAGRSAFGDVNGAGARSQLGVSTGLTVMAGDGVGLMPLRWSARAGAQRRRVVGIKPTDRGAGKGVSFIIRSAVGGDATRAFTMHTQSGWDGGAGYASVAAAVRGVVGNAG